MRNLRVFALSLIAIILLGAPARAQGPSSLSDLLERVDRFHPKILEARLARRIAAANVLEKQGAFDAVLEVASEVLRYNSGGKAKTAFDNFAAVSFLTREGIKVTTGMELNRGDVKSPLSTTGSAGEYFVDVKIPLLRGSGMNPKLAGERQAILKEGTIEAYYRLTRLKVLLDASIAWWDWMAARQRLEVARQVLDVAVQRSALVRDRVEAGDIPAMDQVEADQEVERRREVLAKGERDVQKTVLKLSLYLWEDGGQPGAMPTLGSATEAFPMMQVLADEDLGQAWMAALEKRPELASLRFEREIVKVDLDLARNDRRPRVDLSLGPGVDFGQGAIGLNYKAGILVTIPLRTREADGRIQAARLRLEQVDLRQASDVRTILVEIQDGASAMNTLIERYEAARRTLELAQRLERGERLRYDLGDGTLFLVNQRERATAEARMRLIDLEAEYAQALYTFRAVTGQL